MKIFLLMVDKIKLIMNILYYFILFNYKPPNILPSKQFYIVYLYLLDGIN